MKRFILASMTLAMSTLGFATTEAPILVKNSNLGLVPPGYGDTERCFVFSDRIEVVNLFLGGEVSAKETHKIDFSPSLISLVQKAALENLLDVVGEQSPCDGPVTTVSANPSSSSEVLETFTLFQTGACGSPTKLRSGDYSSILLKIVNKYCPTTF
jgi:hypothetical protein